MLSIVDQTSIADMRSDETSPGKNSRAFPFFSSDMRSVVPVSDVILKMTILILDLDIKKEKKVSETDKVHQTYFRRKKNHSSILYTL